MSYQVLARKWRPKQFTEMVGQGHVLKALVNALDDNRLHHAYLFTGTRGVGKTSIARLFAKALNCENGVSSEPCGVCSSCVEIAEGRFVDLIEVDAASRTKVEDTRELLENVQYAPSRGRFKVYLIDEVHMLSKSSFNALLKTLEEPPPHVKFLLATTDPQKLPVTVLSRCLQFNLKNMIPQRIVEHLKTVLTAEQIPFDEEALWLLARSADGSMRDALSLTDQSIAFGAGSIHDEDVRVMLGTIDLKLVYQILQSLIDANGVELLKCVDDLAQFSPDYQSVLGDIISLLHRIAIAQTVPAALDNSMGDKQQVIGLAKQLCAEDVQLFYQVALHGRKDLPLVPDAREGLEMVLMRMLAFRPASAPPVKLNPLSETGNAEKLITECSGVDKANAQQIDQQAIMQPGVTDAEQPVAPLTESLSSAPREEVQRVSELTSSAATAQLDEKTEQLIQNNHRLSDVVIDPVPAGVEGSHSDNVTIDQGLSGNLNSPIDLEQPAEENKELGGSELPANNALNKLDLDEELKKTEKEGTHKPVIENQDVQVIVDKDEKTNYQATQGIEAKKMPSQSQVKTVPYADTPPWDDVPEQAASYQERGTVEQRFLEQQPSVDTHSAVHQINISQFLDEPVKDYSELELDVWPSLVGAVGFTGMTAHIAENLSLEEVTENSLQFNVSKVQQNVLDETQKKRIEQMLSSYFDKALKVRFDAQQSMRETPFQCFEKMRAKRLREAIDHFQNDTIVKQIVSTFSGQIDRSSIMPLD
jgi:DNA polymerase-3 subunit gamma/tau